MARMVRNNKKPMKRPVACPEKRMSRAQQLAVKQYVGQVDGLTSSRVQVVENWIQPDASQLITISAVENDVFTVSRADSDVSLEMSGEQISDYRKFFETLRFISPVFASDNLRLDNVLVRTPAGSSMDAINASIQEMFDRSVVSGPSMTPAEEIMVVLAIIGLAVALTMACHSVYSSVPGSRDPNGDCDGDGDPNWSDPDRDGDGIPNEDDPNQWKPHRKNRRNKDKGIIAPPLDIPRLLSMAAFEHVDVVLDHELAGITVTPHNVQIPPVSIQFNL